MKVLTFTCVIILFSWTNSFPISDDPGEPNDEAKGVLDGATGTSTTSPSISGLGGLSGLGQNVGNAGPLLIIGGFQAVITKFDPALVQSIPGLTGVSPIGK